MDYKKSMITLLPSVIYVILSTFLEWGSLFVFSVFSWLSSFSRTVRFYSVLASSIWPQAMFMLLSTVSVDSSSEDWPFDDKSSSWFAEKAANKCATEFKSTDEKSLEEVSSIKGDFMSEAIQVVLPSEDGDKLDSIDLLLMRESLCLWSSCILSSR